MKKIYFIGLILAFFIANQTASAADSPDPNFNPNYIISDAEIINYSTMNVDQIQNFLTAHNSGLSSYITTDNVGRNLTAAQSVFNVANTNGINPKFILVLIQKEQGLVEDDSPSKSQLDWATGYGCPDSGGCSERWRGFWKQINSASLQFKDYLNNPNQYSYKMGQTYNFSNPYSTTVKGMVTVTPSNIGTAALYNYTPHVYNGNYNFWKLWNKYFGGFSYPNGTLLQAQGDPAVWLIQNGFRRPFLAKGALTSRYDINKIITIKKDDLANYQIGAPIKFPQYSIVRSPDNQLYLLVDDTKRPFTSKQAFQRLGYNPEEVMPATIDDLSAYSNSTPINETDAYTTGALLQDKKTGGVYWVQSNTKAPIIDPIYLKTKFKNKRIVKASSLELDKYKTVSAIKFNDGDLIKITQGFTTYVVENGALRPIASDDAFKALGYKKENVILISIKLFLTYPIGPNIGNLN